MLTAYSIEAIWRLKSVPLPLLQLGGQHWRSFRLDAGADAGVDSGAASATDVDATGRVRALWTNSAQLRHAVTAYPSSDAGQLYLLHHLSAAVSLQIYFAASFLSHLTAISLASTWFGLLLPS